MKTFAITCLFLMAAGVAAAQDQPKKKSAQHVNETQKSDATLAPGSVPAPSSSPDPQQQPAERSINEKGLSTPVSNAPKRPNVSTTPVTNKKEEKVKARPQE